VKVDIKKFFNQVFESKTLGNIEIDTALTTEKHIANEQVFIYSDELAETILIPFKEFLEEIGLASYLSENQMYYNHMVKMAERNDDYGDIESNRYLEKASDILFNMQLVSADPASYDLEFNSQPA
jgi:hypothetical protein